VKPFDGTAASSNVWSQFDCERLLEFGVPVVTTVTTAICDDQVSFRCRGKKVLVRKMDGIRLRFPEAE
jgi:hypothetical protein